MSDQTILITGGTGGIGYQSALALARSGARVIVTGRNRANGEAAVAALKQSSGNPNVELLLGDLSTQAGVRSLVDQFTQRVARLDVLINNAGLAESQRRLTVDGVEAMFAVNVIAPWLLTQRLMEPLKASGAGRVVNVTGGEVKGPIDLANLQAERSFAGLSTYSHTKLIMMAMMYEFAQRTKGVTINVCYPGQASTKMTQGVTREMLPGAMRWLFPLFKWMTRPDGGKSAAKAARSTVYLASSREVAGVTGQYFDTHCKQVEWPSAVLDQMIRQQAWAQVEQFSHMAAGTTSDSGKIA